MDHDLATTPTAMLREEHQLILQVVRSLSARIAADRTGDPLDYDFMARYITFFRLFADACHHGKEEELLFPGLEAHGLPHDAGPIAVMLYEHEQGRSLVRSMEASLDGARDGDERASSELRSAAEGFIELIVAHIGKENNILFSMADGMIVGPDCRDLCAGYDEVCSRRFEGQTKQDLERLAALILEA
ncbi:MAG: hemerythrin [bacterium]|nr:hemerythrin [bacterium]